jgi:hypothetical protein
MNAVCCWHPTATRPDPSDTGVRPADAAATSGTNIDHLAGDLDRSWQPFVTFLELNVVASE